MPLAYAMVQKRCMMMRNSAPGLEEVAKSRGVEMLGCRVLEPDLAVPVGAARRIWQRLCGRGCEHRRLHKEEAHEAFLASDHRRQDLPGLERLRFPLVERPGREDLAVPYPLRAALHGLFEEAYLVRQCDGLDSVRVADLVEAGEAVEHIQDDAGLDRGGARLGRLKLPYSLHLGQQAVYERMWIPVLSAVWKASEAALIYVIKYVSNVSGRGLDLGASYASIGKHGVDK
jgi:hypothetical protein